MVWGCELKSDKAMMEKRLYTASTNGRSCGRATLQQHFKKGVVLICEPTRELSEGENGKRFRRECRWTCIKKILEILAQANSLVI